MNNIKTFFSIWFIILLLNQIFIFHTCFTPHCIFAALPHTGIIAFFLTLFSNNEEKEFERKISEKKDESNEYLHSLPQKNIDIRPKNELDISLTPDKYLTENEKRKRQDIINCKSSLLLDIIHEKDNPHDSNALLISHDGIKIGYITKKNVADKVDAFSFDKNGLKSNIHLLWNGNKFFLTSKNIDTKVVTTVKLQQKQNIIIDQNILYKQSYKNIPPYLESKGIHRFYHFTDIKNIDSIIENGGLYSWKGLADKKINVSLSSDELSRSLDTKKNLQDYIRLSFTDYHPMSTKVEREDGKNLVWLEIDIDVALWESTLFSDMNATDNNVTVQGDFYFLKNLDFYLFSQKYNNLNFLEKKKYQAEILVKDFLPIKYIKNINTVNQPTHKGFFG